MVDGLEMAYELVSRAHVHLRFLVGEVGNVVHQLSRPLAVGVDVGGESMLVCEDEQALPALQDAADLGRLAFVHRHMEQGGALGAKYVMARNLGPSKTS